MKVRIISGRVRMITGALSLFALFAFSGAYGQNMVIPRKSSWSYNDSGQNLGTAWFQISYNDQSWSTGLGIFGYGSGDEGTLINFGPNSSSKYITTYFRKNFTVSSLAVAKSVKIRILKDDGVAVYLNGKKVITDNLPAEVNYQTLALVGINDEDERIYSEFSISAENLLVGQNLIAVELHQYDPASSDLSFDLELELSSESLKSVRINEVLPSNFSYYPDPTYNQFVDWIELYNPQSSSFQLGGFYLTDNLNKPTKWQFPDGTVIPPLGYLIVFADGLNEGMHANFSLSTDGERLGLFTSGLELVDSLSYPAMSPNHSYGLLSDEVSRGYFGDPSPMAANLDGALNPLPVSEPLFSQNAGFYPGAISLVISTSEPQAVIRYTTNGSDPDPSSARYETPINISQNMVVKARVYVPGAMPSKIITRSYFINRNHDLPVISIGTNSKFLNDPDVGIYREDRLPERRDWERPGTIEFFEPNGSLGFQINIDYRLFGRGAIYFPQKSLAIFPRGMEDNGGLSYPLFPGTPVDNFQSFILRSSSDDWRNTMFRDGMLHTLLKDQVDLEYMDYRPAVLYINGQYMGIHNIRDKLNEDYLASHKGVDPNNLDLLFVDNDFSPPSIEVKSGDSTMYWSMWNFITQNDMSKDENYQIASTMLDIENYQNYCSVQIITGNRSWLHNRRIWRPRTPDGKFRYMLFDLDYGYIFLDQNVLSSLNSKDMIFKSLMKNLKFKAGLIQKLATLSNTVYTPERVIQFVDSLSAIIQSEIPRHATKWGGTYSGVFTSLSEWQAKVKVLRDFANSRPAVQEGYIQAFLGQPGKSNISLEVVPAHSGRIFVNNKLVTDDKFNADYTNNYPLTITAEAAPGYHFTGWLGFSSSNSVLFSRGKNWKYNDSGSNLGTSWTGKNFSDANWAEGNGPLGYGRDHVQTTISYGSNGNQKYPTAYFRKKFTIAQTSDYTGFLVRLMRDDGAIVYLNGVEQFRVNLPGGTVSYSTYATTAVWGADEVTYFDYALNKSDMVDGENVIAVEIHQESAASSDLLFDLELVGQVSNGLIVKEVSLSPSPGQKLSASFAANAESDIVISEVFYRPSTNQGGDDAEFIELFNKGNAPVSLAGWSFSQGISFTFPQGSSLAAHSYLILAFNSASYSSLNVPVYQWSSGNLSNVGEPITLVDVQGRKKDEVSYGISAPWPVSVSGYSIELGDVSANNADGNNWSIGKLEGGTPGGTNSQGKFAKLHINELLGLAGNNGYLNGDDWIEVVNTGTEPVDLGGLYLSDDLQNPLKFQIPVDNSLLTTVAAGGYKVFVANGFEETSSLHLGFKLNANQGAVVLSEKVGETYRIIDQVSYNYLVEGQTYGRNPDAVGNFVNLEVPSPGASNYELTPNIIVPAQIAPGDRFPVVVRVTNENGIIDRDVNTTLTLSSTIGSVTPNQVKIRNGVGTLSVKVSSTADFSLKVSGYNYSRKIKVNSNIPKVILKGPIVGTKYLISGVDYILNDSLDIPSGAVLYAMPGARLLIDNKLSIKSKGLIKFKGSFANPIIVMPKDDGELWGGIKFQNTPDYNDFEWTMFTASGGDSTKAQGHSETQPTLYAQSTKMRMNQCFLVDTNGKSIYGLYSEMDINNSVISRCDMGPEFAFCHSVVRNSWFIDIPDDDRSHIDDDNDGIYFRDVLTPNDPPNILENCVVYGVEDDAVDMSETRLIISDCILNRSYEKGISAGWRSDLLVERTLFFDNYIGVSSSFWTPVVVNQSTFYKNDYALYSSDGGGGIVNNSILSDHLTYYAKDSTDAWYFNYCLSDKDPNLFGNHNLFGNPLFVNKAAQNFHLSAGSPAINAGNPKLKRDADGSPADLGMFPYDGRSDEGLVISEIYYNPPAAQGADEVYEFIEITNPGANLVDLSGFRLIDGIEFTFPAGSSISPGSIVVVAADAFTYRHLPVDVFEWDPGKLSNSGERIALIDANGALMDEVIFSDLDPWPLSADGDGSSLELLDAFSDNALATSWVASAQWGGSPGQVNLLPDFSKISLNEIMAMDVRSQTDLYEGNFSWLEVYNSGINPVDLGGCMFSLANGSEYIIPVGLSDQTLVHPNDHLVFVFNSDPFLGGNHVPLKWNNSGDLVKLNRKVGTDWVVLSTIAINGSTGSYGRYPDGSNTFYSFREPSPGAPNSLASGDLITMKTVASGERMPMVLWKKDLPKSELTQRNANVVSLSGSPVFNDTRFPMVEGVGSMVAKVTADQDFKIQVGEWNDTVGIQVSSRRHVFVIDKYLIFDQVWTADHDYYINQNLDLRAGVTITIMPGTRVFLAKGASIKVSGSLISKGTKSNPVLFTSKIWGEPWGQIRVNEFSGTTSFDYTFFINGGGEAGKSDGHTSSQAVISARSVPIELNHCFFIDNPGKAVYSSGGEIIMKNSLINRSDAGVEGNAAFMDISDTYFTFLPTEDALSTTGENDAIFSTGQNASGKNSVVSNVVMAYLRDDGFDLYDNANFNLSNSNLHKIGDKAVSVTQANISTSKALIHNSDEGLVAKEAGRINADHMTLFFNTTSLHAYTNNAGVGHGKIEIGNSILSQSTGVDLNIADGSTITTTYTLSDKALISGEGNIFGDPKFVNTALGDFSLQQGSPAINSGNPLSPLDPDGSRTDMGAFIGESFAQVSLVINEIMYAPKPGDNAAEFIEIVNTGTIAIDITGYYFSSGIVFEFPPASLIGPGEYILVSKNAALYRGKGFQIFEWTSGELSNSGEEITLMNSDDKLVDLVSYSNTGSWPTEPNGQGPSLELRNVALDNFLSTNWQASYEIGGTPGLVNSAPSTKGLVINELMARNTSTIADETGAYVDWIELYNPSGNYIQLKGLFLSKLASNLGYYEITGTESELLMGPNEYRIFWLDDQVSKGTFHTNFELAASEGFVALSRNNGGTMEILDSVSYTNLTADVSWGRYPNADGDFVLFTEPTPGMVNSLATSRIQGIFINEIMSRNASIYLNDIGEYDDWIELYNSNNEPVDVGGLYLSDDLSQPLKYRLPTSASTETTIPSKGFLMLFPSAKTEAGVRHLNFQLAGNGEQVGLAQVYLGQTLFIDSVTYPALLTDKTWGRTNDGGQYWTIFETPTPAATNGISSVNDMEKLFSILEVFPNPVSDKLHIRFSYPEPFNYQIELLTPLSQTLNTIAQGRANPANETIQLSFDLGELGVDRSSIVFLRIRINSEVNIIKTLIIAN